MNKKTILGILIVLNVLLGVVFLKKLGDASEELAWVYFERGNMASDSILKYLDWENYGDVAVMSRSVRVGAKVNDEDRDFYLLGEYADMLYQEKVFAAKGDADAAKRCAERCVDIRAALPKYAVVMDKMDQGIENAIRE